jgi:hypothetical protein
MRGIHRVVVPHLAVAVDNDGLLLQCCYQLTLQYCRGLPIAAQVSWDCGTWDIQLPNSTPDCRVEGTTTIMTNLHLHISVTVMLSVRCSLFSSDNAGGSN